MVFTVLGVRGKEKATVGELYDLFESVSRTRPVRTFTLHNRTFAKETTYQLASEMWPVEVSSEHDDDDDDDDGSPVKSKEKVLSVERRIAQELSVIKRPKRETRFGEDRSFNTRVQQEAT